MDRGYLPWLGGTYLSGGYLPWLGSYLSWWEVPTLAGGIPTLAWGYLPWVEGYLPWLGIPILAGGTYLGFGAPTLAGGTYLFWRGTYLGLRGYQPSPRKCWWYVSCVLTQEDFLITNMKSLQLPVAYVITNAEHHSLTRDEQTLKDCERS